MSTEYDAVAYNRRQGETRQLPTRQQRRDDVVRARDEVLDSVSHALEQLCVDRGLSGSATWLRSARDHFRRRRDEAGEAYP